MNTTTTTVAGPNAETLARTARVLTNPAIQARTLGRFASVQHGIWHRDLAPGPSTHAVQVHVIKDVSALLAWFYLLTNPRLAAQRFEYGSGSVHVYVQGTLDGDPVVAWSGLSDRVRDALDVVWGEDDTALLSVHQLRNAQVGAQLAAVSS